MLEIANITSVLGPYGSWLLPMAAFVAVTLGLLLAVRLFRRKESRFEQRLSVISPDDLDGHEPESAFASIAPALAAQLPESKKEGKEFQKLLKGAGLYKPGTATTIYALRFLLLIVPLVLAGIAAVMAPTDQSFKIVAIGVCCGVGLSITPRLYVFFRRRKRLAEIRAGLPDAMDMLAMCVEGGAGLSASLTHVARRLTGYPALAQELLILQRQAEVGSLSHALADLTARIDLPELRGLCALLCRGDRLGTQLTGSLMDQSDHLRTQRRQKATLQANKTPVKLVLPLMLCFAPAAMILLVSPAVLDLKEFLAPSDGRGVLNSQEDIQSSQGIVGTLRGIEQGYDQ